jgi:hypothetical protein
MGKDSEEGEQMLGFTVFEANVANSVNTNDATLKRR